MKICQWWKGFLLLGVLSFGCVTRTERIPYHRYYDPPDNESVMDELRREFGWQKPSPWVHEEPFYKQAARSVKETVTGWFKSDNPPANPLLGGTRTVQEFQQAQKEAIQRLEQQQMAEPSLPNGFPGVTTEPRSPETGSETPVE